MMDQKVRKNKIKNKKPFIGERKINQMIKNQKNRYTMYEAVTAYLEDNSSKYSDNVEFADHFSSYRAAVTEIALTEAKH